MTLDKILYQLEQFATTDNKKNEKVSAADVHWHIDHSLKVINSVSKNILQSDPATYQNKFNWKRIYVFIKGAIPRGVGKAPKAVIPPDNITIADIMEQLNSAKKYSDALVGLQPNQYFKHPLFGMLNAKKTRKFLKIHTMHHLKIIKDILQQPS